MLLLVLSGNISIALFQVGFARTRFTWKALYRSWSADAQSTLAFYWSWGRLPIRILTCWRRTLTLRTPGSRASCTTWLSTDNTWTASPSVMASQTRCWLMLTDVELTWENHMQQNPSEACNNKVPVSHDMLVTLYIYFPNQISFLHYIPTFCNIPFLSWSVIFLGHQAMVTIASDHLFKLQDAVGMVRRSVKWYRRRIIYKFATYSRNTMESSLPIKCPFSFE